MVTVIMCKVMMLCSTMKSLRLAKHYGVNESTAIKKDTVTFVRSRLRRADEWWRAEGR